MQSRSPGTMVMWPLYTMGTCARSSEREQSLLLCRYCVGRSSASDAVDGSSTGTAVRTTHFPPCMVECGLLIGTSSAKGIMASGHVNRANRPNPWLHRPMVHTFKKVLANSEPSTHGGKADTAFAVRNIR